MGGFMSYSEPGTLRLGCPYIRFGCDVLGLDRKQLKHHKQEHIQKHIDLISARIEEQSHRISELERQNKQVKLKYRSVLNSISNVIDYVADIDEDIKGLSGQKYEIVKNENKIKFLEDKVEANERKYSAKNLSIIDKLFGIVKSVEENKIDYKEISKHNDKMQLVEKEIKNVKDDIESIDSRVLMQGKRLNSHIDICGDDSCMRDPKRIKRELHLPQFDCTL